MRKPIVLLASVASAVLLASAITLLSAAPGAQAANPKPLYPNLKTLKPKGLRFGTYPIDGTRHHILRFTNTVWNAGQGPLDLRGKTVTTPSGKKKTKVFQRIYDRKGDYKTSEAVGLFVYHPAPSHDHFHFGDFAEYQLWTRADYDKWVDADKSYQEQFEQKGAKTTFCVYDTTRVRGNLPGSPRSKVYRRCDEKRQGLSVGWGDTYKFKLPDQWIDLGGAPLEDGDYVLRSVADPKNRLYESANKSDTSRESQQANEGVTYFSVQGGAITITN